MAVRQFSELYDLILPYVPAVELPLVDYHIRRVVREFTRRTTLWRKQVTITTQPGVNDYLLSPYDATETPQGGTGGGWVLPSSIGASVQATTENYTPNIGYPGTVSVTAVGDIARIRFGDPNITDQLPGTSDFVISVLDATSAPLAYPIRLTTMLFDVDFGDVTYGYTFFAADPTGLGNEFAGTVEFRDVDGNVWATVPNLAFNDSVPAGYYAFTTYDPAVIEGPTNPPTVAVLQASAVVLADLRVEVFAPAVGEPEICDPYSVISVTCNGRPLPPRPEDMREPYGARPPMGKPNSWYSPSARVVHLYPTPDAAYTVVVDVVCALTMSPTSPTLPEFIFVDYREVIADGVVASLKVLGNKPWFDPEGAAIYSRRYANAVQGLRAKLRDANQPSTNILRGPRFGR